MEDKKKDHIDLTFSAQTTPDSLDKRFNYEPLLSAFPSGEDKSFDFLGKRMNTPIWVSSMTGGTKEAGNINRNLARACNEFGMGMGLGSCRILLDENSCFEDFNMRPVIGNEFPLYANLGIAQVENMLANNQNHRIVELLEKLQVDGLIVHVNPIQEWSQPEGDRINRPPIDTLRELLEQADYPVIVKEVGQGMGPASLQALLEMPLEAIEFAAYGGTNFTLLELLRTDEQTCNFYKPVSCVGHDALDMTEEVNRIANRQKNIKCRQLIISGGIRNFLDGYYLIRKSKLPAIYGQASSFLFHARGDYPDLRNYVNSQVRGLQLAASYLTIKEYED